MTGHRGGQPAADPDRACPHLHFAAEVDVARLTRSDDDLTVVAYSATVQVRCAAPGCGERFRWIGAPAGLLTSRPACSVDEFSLYAPLRPASADLDFGLGIPGYAISARVGGTSS